MALRILDQAGRDKRSDSAFLEVQQKTIRSFGSFLDKKVTGIHRSSTQIRKVARELIQERIATRHRFDGTRRTRRATRRARIQP